jgi:hypothetical protein
MNTDQGKTKRGIRSWSVTRRTITVAGVLALLVSSLAVPASATSTRAGQTTNQTSGMAAALPSILGTAPAGFQQQLKNYLNSIASGKGYSNLNGAYSVAAKAQAASALLDKANPQDLAILNYLVSQLTNWQQQPKQLRQAASMYAQAKAWQDRTFLHPLAFGDTCPFSFATIVLVDALKAVQDIFELVDQQVADSDLIVVAGEGATLPISPYKVISQVIKLVLDLAAEAAHTAYDINNECQLDLHYKQHDQLNAYIGTMVQQKTLTIHTSALDTYHYQFTVQFEGQPVDPVNETLQGLYQSSSGTPTANDITSSVAFQRLDTGVYQFAIPPNLVAAGYRLKVEFDNGQDVNGNTLAYFGDVAFAKTSQ